MIDQAHQAFFILRLFLNPRPPLCFDARFVATAFLRGAGLGLALATGFVAGLALATGFVAGLALATGFVAGLALATGLLQSWLWFYLQPWVQS